MRATLAAVLQARWSAGPAWTCCSELSDFVGGFEQLVEGFRARAAAIAAALRAPTPASRSSPRRSPTHDRRPRLAFDPSCAPAAIPVAGIIANRVYDFPPLAADAGGAAHRPRCARKLLANYADFAALGARDARALRALRAARHAPLLATVPVLGRRRRRWPALRQIAALLAGSGAAALRPRRGAPSASRLPASARCRPAGAALRRRMRRRG